MTGIAKAASAGSTRSPRPRPQRLAALALAALFSACTAATPAPNPVRETMQFNFQALETVLPVVLSPSGWSEPGARESVRRSVAVLRVSAAELDSHARKNDVSFRFLGRSLAQDARALQRAVAAQNDPATSYFALRMTETCVACHSRLPAANQRRFGDALIERVDRRTLPPLTRASLEAATREFDSALQTYEEQFGDPQTPVDLLEYSDAISAYLILALRVRRDPARAQFGLAILRRRSDLSEEYDRYLRTWSSAITELEPALRETPSLERARSILDAGRALDEFPFDAAGRVHAIVASSLLYRHIEQDAPAGPALAEALFTLAQTDAFTRRSFELREPEHYLEQAIAEAPHSPLAERAFAVLEIETVLAHRLSGAPLAPDVSEWLARLREQSRTAPVAAPREGRPTR
jgi:hypothetical protein